MRHLHPGFWSFVAWSLLYYLTFYVFLLYRPVSLVSPLKGNGCFTPDMTMKLQTLDKSHKNHPSKCPLTRGPWLRYPLPQHCSAAAKQFRISWLEQPSEFTNHTHNRSLLPRLPRLLRRRSGFPKRKRASLPVRNTLLPMGRLMRMWPNTWKKSSFPS